MTQIRPGQKSAVSRRELQLSGSKQFIYCDISAEKHTHPNKQKDAEITADMFTNQTKCANVFLAELLFMACSLSTVHEIITTGCQLSAAIDTAGD